MESARHQQFNGLLMIHAWKLAATLELARRRNECRELVVLKEDEAACVAACETIQFLSL